MTAEHASDEQYCPRCRAVFRAGFTHCPLDGSPLAGLVEDPLEGSAFADRYVIEECIGAGAMGRVYRARHRHMARRFAIKVLFGDHAADTKMQSRFAREADNASRLDHPNVISVVDFGQTDEGLFFLVMPFVEGPSLAEVVGASAPLPARRVVRLVRQLCLGLAHAHDRGLVHRDFKAENILVADDGDGDQAKIVDLGIAMLTESASGGLTTQGTVLGTPAVMSPEQATGGEVDHRTDLFALGVVMYEMLAGKLPFDGTAVEIAHQNAFRPVPPIAERVPGLRVVPALEQIALKLMAKRPADRYASGHEVIQELDRLGVEALGSASGDMGRAAGGKARADGDFGFEATLPASDFATPSDESDPPAPTRGDGAAEVRAKLATGPTMLSSSSQPGEPGSSLAAGTTQRIAPTLRRSWHLKALAAGGVAAAGLAAAFAVFGGERGDPTPAGAEASAAVDSSAALPAPADDEARGGAVDRSPATDEDETATPSPEPAHDEDAPAPSADDADTARLAAADEATREPAGEATREPAGEATDDEPEIELAAEPAQPRPPRHQASEPELTPEQIAARVNARYRRVSAKVHEAVTRGASGAQGHLAAFEDIPIPFAVRDPAALRDIGRRLRSLERQLD
jgi:eukaryotic-like serine/threonine-protein kinase